MGYLIFLLLIKLGIKLKMEELLIKNQEEYSFQLLNHLVRHLD